MKFLFDVELGPLLRSADGSWSWTMNGRPVLFTSQNLRWYTVVKRIIAETINRNVPEMSNQIWVEKFVLPTIAENRPPEMEDLHKVVVKLPTWFTLQQMYSALWEAGLEKWYNMGTRELGRELRFLGGYRQNRNGKAVWRLMI